METAFILITIAVAVAVVWLFFFYKRNKNSNSMGPPKSDENSTAEENRFSSPRQSLHNLAEDNYTTANSLDGSLNVGSYRDNATYSPHSNLSGSLGHTSRGYNHAFDDDFRSQNIPISDDFMETEYSHYQRSEQPQGNFGYQSDSIINEELSHYQARGRHRLDSLEQDFEVDLASSLSGFNLSSEESLSPAYVESNSGSQFGVNHLSHLTEEQRNRELTYAQEQRFAQTQATPEPASPSLSNKHINLEQGKSSYLNSNSLKQGFKPTGPRIPVNSTINTLTAEDFPYSDRVSPAASQQTTLAAQGAKPVAQSAAQAKSYSSQAQLLREMQSQRQQSNLGSGQKTAPWNQNSIARTTGETSPARAASVEVETPTANYGTAGFTATTPAATTRGEQASLSQAKASAQPQASAISSETPVVSKPITAPQVSPTLVPETAPTAAPASSDVQEIMKVVQSLGLDPKDRAVLLEQLLKSKQAQAAANSVTEPTPELVKEQKSATVVAVTPTTPVPEGSKKTFSGLELKRYHEKDLQIRKLIETAYPDTKHEDMLVFKITSRLPETAEYFKNLIATLKNKIHVVDVLPGLITAPNRTRVVLKSPAKRPGASMKKQDPVTVCHLYKSDLRGFSESEFEVGRVYNELFVCIPTSMVYANGTNVENQIIRLMQLLKEARAYLQGTLTLRGREISDHSLGINKSFLKVVKNIIDDTTIDIPKP